MSHLAFRCEPRRQQMESLHVREPWAALFELFRRASSHAADGRRLGAAAGWEQADPRRLQATRRPMDDQTPIAREKLGQTFLK
jgi:hypothetical protein